MKLLRFLLILLAVFSTRSVSSQENAAETDIRAMLQRCDLLDRQGERDSSLELLGLSLQMASRSAEPALVAESLLARIRHFNRYQLRDSLERNLDPLIRYATDNSLPEIRVEALYFKAAHWLETQRYREALIFCDEANNLAHALNNRRLNGLGQLCKGSVLRTSQNDSQVPLPYFYRALEILRQTSDTAGMIRAALLISSGEQNEQKKQEMILLASSLSERYTSETTRMGLLNFKASHLPPKEALPLLEEALSIARKLRIPNMIQHIYLQISARYQALEQYDRAINYMDRARAAFPGNLPDDGALHYYEIYKAKGDYQKAVMYNERFRQYEDERKQSDMKSFTAEWETRMNVRETEWELERQQKEIANQQTRSLLLMLVLALALIAGAISLQAYRRQKKARKILSVQHETISRQAGELQSLERLKSRFFANVSHELRTPLTLMIGPVRRLLRQGHWAESERTLLTLLQNNTTQLLKLVNEILDLSKLETGRLELQTIAVNWFGLLHPMITQFGSVGKGESVALKFDYRADHALNVWLDAGKFEKIVHNFLSNAMKFTPSGGQVELIAEDAGEYLRVAVRDNGPGIHPDDLPHIFDRFYQSKLPDALAQGGTGIGLSLCKELAELMEGQVWVESDYGRGSAFFLLLPAKRTETGIVVAALPTEEPESIILTVTAEAQLSEMPDGMEIRRRARILVVEDHAELRRYLHIILSDFDIMEAENGKVAIDLLQACIDSKGAVVPPDLIVSDLMMPVLDGFQLLEWVKDRDEFRHIPFIMLTARADVKVKLRALRVGVDDYLLKPFVEEELRTRILNLLAHYRDRLKLYDYLETEPDDPPDKAAPVMSALNARWLEEVEKHLAKKLHDNAFHFSWLASEVHLSERQFRRKVQQLTGLSPNQYLQEMRLQMAKDLLLGGRYGTVKEVGFAVGYRDTTYFSSLFNDRFGANPSSYLH